MFISPSFRSPGCRGKPGQAPDIVLHTGRWGRVFQLQCPGKSSGDFHYVVPRREYFLASNVLIDYKIYILICYKFYGEISYYYHVLYIAYC